MAPHQSAAWCDGVALLVVAPPAPVGDTAIPLSGDAYPCCAFARAATAVHSSSGGSGGGGGAPLSGVPYGLLALSLIAAGADNTPVSGNSAGGPSASASASTVGVDTEQGAGGEGGGDDVHGDKGLTEDSSSSRARPTDPAVVAASKAVHENPTSAEAWGVLSSALYAQAVREGKSKKTVLSHMFLIWTRLSA